MEAGIGDSTVRTWMRTVAQIGEAKTEAASVNWHATYEKAAAKVAKKRSFDNLLKGSTPRHRTLLRFMHEILDTAIERAVMTSKKSRPPWMPVYEDPFKDLPLVPNPEPTRENPLSVSDLDRQRLVKFRTPTFEGQRGHRGHRRTPESSVSKFEPAAAGAAATVGGGGGGVAPAGTASNAKLQPSGGSNSSVGKLPAESPVGSARSPDVSGSPTPADDDIPMRPPIPDPISEAQTVKLATAAVAAAEAATKSAKAKEEAQRQEIARLERIPSADTLKRRKELEDKETQELAAIQASRSSLEEKEKASKREAEEEAKHIDVQLQSTMDAIMGDFQKEEDERRTQDEKEADDVAAAVKEAHSSAEARKPPEPSGNLSQLVFPHFPESGSPTTIADLPPPKGNLSGLHFPYLPEDSQPAVPPAQLFTWRQMLNFDPNDPEIVAIIKEATDELPQNHDPSRLYSLIEALHYDPQETDFSSSSDYKEFMSRLQREQEVKSLIRRRQMRNRDGCLQFTLHNEIALRKFHAFLQLEYSDENINFWLACERFRHHVYMSQIAADAEIILKTFILPTADQEVNVTATARDAILESAGTPHIGMFAQAQQEVFRLMSDDSHVRFMRFEEVIYGNYFKDSEDVAIPTLTLKKLDV